MIPRPALEDITTDASELRKHAQTVIENPAEEIVVHIDDTLGKERQEDLLQGVETHEAFIEARFTPGRPHLMLVNYDADKAHTWDVLNYVRK